MSSQSATATDTTATPPDTADAPSERMHPADIGALRVGIDIDRGMRGAIRLCRIRIKRIPNKTETATGKTYDWAPQPYWLWWVRPAKDGRGPKHGTELIYLDGMLPSQAGKGMAKADYEIEFKEWRFRQTWFDGGDAKQRNGYLESMIAMVEGDDEAYQVADLVDRGNKKGAATAPALRKTSCSKTKYDTSGCTSFILETCPPWYEAAMTRNDHPLHNHHVKRSIVNLIEDEYDEEIPINVKAEDEDEVLPAEATVSIAESETTIVETSLTSPLDTFVGSMQGDETDASDTGSVLKSSSDSGLTSVRTMSLALSSTSVSMTPPSLKGLDKEELLYRLEKIKLRTEEPEIERKLRQPRRT